MKQRGTLIIVEKIHNDIDYLRDSLIKTVPFESPYQFSLKAGTLGGPYHVQINSVFVGDWQYYIALEKLTGQDFFGRSIWTECDRVSCYFRIVSNQSHTVNYPLNYPPEISLGEIHMDRYTEDLPPDSPLEAIITLLIEIGGLFINAPIATGAGLLVDIWPEDNRHDIYYGLLNAAYLWLEDMGNRGIEGQRVIRIYYENKPITLELHDPSHLEPILHYNDGIDFDRAIFYLFLPKAVTMVSSNHDLMVDLGERQGLIWIEDSVDKLLFGDRLGYPSRRELGYKEIIFNEPPKAYEITGRLMFLLGPFQGEYGEYVGPPILAPYVYNYDLWQNTPAYAHWYCISHAYSSLQVGQDWYSACRAVPQGEELCVELSELGTTITLKDVADSGTITVKTISIRGRSIFQEGISLLPVCGREGIGIHLAFTGIFASAEIAVKYNEHTILGFQEKDLRLFKITEDGHWDDITTHVDTDKNIIYGQTDSFSTFVLGYETGTIPPDKVITHGPNPVPAEGCIFWLDLPDDTLDATIKIFDIDGAELLDICLLDPTADRCPQTDRWLPQDDQGRLLGTGLYLYVVEIKHTDGTTTYSSIHKMVISR